MTNDATRTPGVSRKPADWEAIERSYRAGILSIRELASQHGVSEAAVRKRAKQHSWSRDLTARVREKVRADLVRTEVRAPEEVARTEDAIVTEAAATVIQVVRSHRKGIRALIDVGETLMGQLIGAAGNREAIEAVIFEETPFADDPDAPAGERSRALARREAMLRAVALPSHAGVLKQLADVMKALVPLERQAFNVDEPAPPPPADAGVATQSALEQLLAKLAKVVPVAKDAA